MKTQSIKIELKAAALAAYLNEDQTMIDGNDGENFYYRRAEYLVLTQEEAERKARAYIQDNLWSFRTEFIASHCKALLNSKRISALNQIQVDLGEDAQPFVWALIEDIDRFVDDAISADGLGSFLSSYDGEEIEKDGFLIYRLN